MKILEVRPHPNAARARRGYVQVRVDGRWWGTGRVYVSGCLHWTTGKGYTCKASGLEDFEFIQLEDDADCDLIEAAGIRPWDVAYGNVFRRCKRCGHLYHLGYGYRPKVKAGGVPLAMGNPRWAVAR